MRYFTTLFAWNLSGRRRFVVWLLRSGEFVFPIATLMPFNPKTAAKRLRIAAIMFALVAGVDLLVAYDAHRLGEHWTIYIKQAVMSASLCIVFLSLARIRQRRAAQSGEERASPQSK